MKSTSSDPSSASPELAHASLELLYEIGREVTADLDLHTLLHRVLFLSMKNVGAISGSLIVLDEHGQPGQSAFLMHGQTHHQTALQLKVTYEHGMAGWVAHHREAALVPDTSKDERWLRRPDDADDRTGAKSALSVPVLAGERLVGVMTLVHPQPGFFNATHLQLIRAISDWAGAAVLRAQLVDNLQAATQRYRELFEDSLDPILISDWQGNVKESNRQAQRIIGLDPEDLHSLRIDALLTVNEEKTGPGFERLKAGAAVTFEAMLHAYTGRDIPIQIVVRSIRYSSDSQLQWILRDLTERKDLDRLRDDLIAMVYHDLRSPLANITSSVEVMTGMLDPAPENATLISLLEIAGRSADRIQRLTESLLDINRLEAGQVVGHRQPHSLNDLAQEALDSVSLSASEKKMHISLRRAGNQPYVMADGEMVRRVIVNLLENAIKYARPNGTIAVRLGQQGDFAVVSVRDDGPGIPPHEKDRIFEKFTRLRSHEGPRGLGLGLAFCRLAVVNLGGQIWVESEAGQGADFRFTLPLVREAHDSHA